MLFGKNRDSEIGVCLPNCTRCARTILLTTANFRTLFFPNSTTDPPITYTNLTKNSCYIYLSRVPIIRREFNCMSLKKREFAGQIPEYDGDAHDIAIIGNYNYTLQFLVLFLMMFCVISSPSQALFPARKRRQARG